MLDINGYEWVDVEYHGEFNGCILVRIENDIYLNPYGMGAGHGIDGFIIHDNYPKCVIWKPLDEQTLQEGNINEEL